MSMPKHSLAVLAASLLLMAMPGRASQDSAPASSHVHLWWAGTGALLLAGGGAFAYYQNREADKDMAVYRGSAFTENTTAYRGKVEDHQRQTLAGLAGAALGGILLVVSF